MFGIPLVALLGYAVTYGPKVIAIIQALEPVIKAAEPIVAKLVSDGLSHEEASLKVFSQMASKSITPEEKQFWLDHDIDHF